MRTYDNCVKVIKAKRLTREQMLEKMDIYVLNDRINEKQYQELVDLMDEVGLE